MNGWLWKTSRVLGVVFNTNPDGARPVVVCGVTL